MAFQSRSRSAIAAFSARWNRSILHKHIALPLCTVSSNLNGQTETQPMKTIKDLPGPVSLPVIGTAWTIFVGASGEPLGKRLLSLQTEGINKYGRIYVNHLPGLKSVLLANPADVAKVLRSDPKYPKRFDIPIFDFYREKRKKIPGVFFANGTDWYKYRSVISKRMLRPKEVADCTPAFNDIVTDFIHRLRNVREPLGSAKESEVQGLDNELFKWSFESVAEVLFDKRFGCLESEVNKDAEAFIQAIGDFLRQVISAALWPNWLFKIYEPKQVKAMFDSFDKIYEYAELFIGRKLQEIAEQEKMQPAVTAGKEEKVGFFEFLLSSDKLTEEDVLASVIDVMFAGVDTTSNTMQWVLYMMARNPDKQDILRQEVLSVIGDSQHASSKALAKMPYLKACVRETLRLYPVLSVLNRISAEDLILSGYHIPAGTQMDFQMYYMSRDESLFEDAGSYKPERWLRKKENNQLNDAVDAFSSIPFGFGTRMCVGRRIAELELHLLLARIVQEFEIRYAPVDEEIEPFVRGVIIPDRPVRVKFVDRRKEC